MHTGSGANASFHSPALQHLGEAPSFTYTTRARAKLETTLHLLQDAGHRHLVRTELATEAIEAGELAAAEAWLGECDAAASVLELDSAHRYARARLCIARGDVSGAYARIGAAPGTIPWSHTHALRGELLRVHLLEQSGDLAGAKTRWQQAEAEAEARATRMLETACEERLTPLTPLAFALALRKRKKLLLRRDVAQKRLARLTRELDGASEIDQRYRKARSSSWLFAFVFVAASLAFSAAWLGLAILAVPDPPASTSSL